MTHPLRNSPLRKAAGWLCHVWGWCACRVFVGTARSTGWLCDLVGAALPFKAVCKAWAKAEVSEVTVKRDVPEEDVGSLVGGLEKIEILFKLIFKFGSVPKDVLKAVLKAKLKISSKIVEKRVVIYKWESIRFYFHLLLSKQCCRSIENLFFFFQFSFHSSCKVTINWSEKYLNWRESNFFLRNWILVSFENKRILTMKTVVWNFDICIFMWKIIWVIEKIFEIFQVWNKFFFLIKIFPLIWKLVKNVPSTKGNKI